MAVCHLRRLLVPRPGRDPVRLSGPHHARGDRRRDFPGRSRRLGSRRGREDVPDRRRGRQRGAQLMAVATMQRQAGPQYPAIKPGMMGMYIFLASEVMFFGSLFASYFYLYGSHIVWPPPAPSATPEFYVNSSPLPFLHTIVLLSTGVTCHFASDALPHDNRRQFFIPQIPPICLGLGSIAAHL